VLTFQDESVKQTGQLIYQTALFESGFLLNDPKDFASKIYDSVKTSLDISPDATVEEEDETEVETESETKEEAATSNQDDQVNDDGDVKDEL
jgi:heat shock protein beta